MFPGKYFSGDGARRDKDDYYWITGRIDDVINVSGHRMGTAEVESALVLHDSVAEAAVVGYPHDIKGQGIYAYVTLMAGKGLMRQKRRSSIPCSDMMIYLKNLIFNNSYLFVFSYLNFNIKRNFKHVLTVYCKCIIVHCNINDALHQLL